MKFKTSFPGFNNYRSVRLKMHEPLQPPYSRVIQKNYQKPSLRRPLLRAEQTLQANRLEVVNAIKARRNKEDQKFSIIQSSDFFQKMARQMQSGIKKSPRNDYRLNTETKRPSTEQSYYIIGNVQSTQMPLITQVHHSNLQRPHSRVPFSNGNRDQFYQSFDDQSPCSDGPGLIEKPPSQNKEIRSTLYFESHRNIVSSNRLDRSFRFSMKTSQEEDFDQQRKRVEDEGESQYAIKVKQDYIRYRNDCQFVNCTIKQNSDLHKERAQKDRANRDVIGYLTVLDEQLPMLKQTPLPSAYDLASNITQEARSRLDDWDSIKQYSKIPMQFIVNQPQLKQDAQNFYRQGAPGYAAIAESLKQLEVQCDMLYEERKAVINKIKNLDVEYSCYKYRTELILQEYHLKVDQPLGIGRPPYHQALTSY